MNTKILEEIGFTKTEIKIYLALLKLGQSTTTNIIRESGIHASKVYEFLDKLISKGIVSYVIKANKKYFSTSEPESLKEFLREKHEEIAEQEKEIDYLIPELKLMKNDKESRIKFEVYEGLKGIKSFYEKLLVILNRGDVQFAVGAPRIANELIEGYLLDWHKRRIKKGIKCKYIYDSDAREFGKIREKMLLTKVKYLPRDIVSPMWIEVSGNNVIIGHIKGKNTVLFQIQDKDIAKGYLDYFDLIWRVSVK